MRGRAFQHRQDAHQYAYARKHERHHELRMSGGEDAMVIKTQLKGRWLGASCKGEAG